jgi:hypothetical protein
MVTSNWTSLGAPGNLSANPSVGKNADGRLEAFAWTVGVDAAKALWHIWQTAPGTTWSNWFSSGGPLTGFVLESSPTIAENQDGRLEGFAIGAGGALWHIWQVVPNGTWSNWALLGIPSTTNNISAPAVGKNQDGRLEVFVIGADGALWHIWQTSPGGTWGSWASLGAQSSSVTVIGDPFVTENGDGRLEAFAIGSDDALWHTWQVSPGGSWEIILIFGESSAIMWNETCV